MKRGVSIILLSVFLISTTEMRQLLKLPLLVEHFIHHKQQNKSITFLGFLTLHYAGKTVKDADYAQDMKLPFKSHSIYNCLLIAASMPVQNNYDLIIPVFTDEINSKIYNPFSLKDAYLASIWQPPKKC